MTQNRPDISLLFSSAEETKQPEMGSVKGEIPEWLKGSLYQTGPGLLDLPNFTMNNFQDGYAILTKVSIAGGKVTLEIKYPETESLQKALEKGKPYFMEYGTTAKREGSKGGFFSKVMTTFSRDDMSDNCSASMYLLGRHLIASSATTFLSQINPSTLCSEQRFDVKKYLGQNGYCCHPLVDDEGVMWNMGFSVLPMVRYNILKIPRATLSDFEIEDILSKRSTVASIAPRWNGALAFNHSFGMTAKYIIFIEQPYAILISRVLSATIKDLAVKDWLEWRGSEKNRFFLIEKATGKVLATEYFSAESFFFLHIINCYEQGSNIVMDIATSKTPSSTEATSLPKLRNNMVDEVDPCIIERYIIPVIENIKNVSENGNLIQGSYPTSSAQAVRKGATVILSPEIIFNRGADRATINSKRVGKKHKFIFAAGSFLSLPDQENSIMAHSICKINVETKLVKMWTASDCDFPGEVMFVPRNESDEEDDGVVVATVSSVSTNTKDFVVFLDAKTFEEIGRASFNSRIPISMHGIFVKEGRLNA